MKLPLFGIRAKMGLGFAVQIALVVLVAAGALLGLRAVQASFESAIAQGLQVEQLARELESALLRARRADADFVLAAQVGAAEQADARVLAHRDHVARMRVLIERLHAAQGARGSPAAQRIQDDLVALKPYVDVYAEDFAAAVALTRRPGVRAQAQAKIEDFRASAAVVEPLVADIARSGQAHAAAAIATARAAGERTVLVVGASLLVAVLAGLALASLLGRQVTVPLQSLARAAEAIGAGDLDTEARVDSRDEIGTLAATFNTMARRLRGLIGSLEERIAERERAEAVARRHAAEVRDLYDNAPCGYHSLDADATFVQINDTELAWLGFQRAEVVGKMKISDLVAAEDAQRWAQVFAAFKQRGEVRDLELRLRRRDGSLMSVLISSTAIRDADGRFVASRSTVYDISERKAAEERIRYLAQHDALTGLPNRLLFQDRVTQALAQAHRSGARVAVLFIDFDYFKHINDSLGHEVGDRVLQAAADRLRHCLREGDSVSRLGGDEFVICLPSIAQTRDAAVVAAKVLEALERAFPIDGRDLHVGGSIGISVSPEDGADATALMRAADTAMYHAKEMGRGQYRFFTAALNEAAQQRLHMANDLRQALSRGEFVLHYQPQVDLESGRIFSVEALLRWQRPGAQPVPCGEFISVAEETGLILPLGEWALREACAQLQRWRAGGFPELQIAVNLSARQFYQSSFDSMVAQVLSAAGLPAAALEFEITESVLLLPSQENLIVLERLAAMGVRLSVDDFGTGYSSLAYLQRFPLHSLKIDRSFVSGIGRDASHTAIVTAIIAMAQSLRLKVIAEGVENAEQAAFLKGRGCLAAQGYHYARPMAAEAFAELLRRQPEVAHR